MSSDQHAIHRQICVNVVHHVAYGGLGCSPITHEIRQDCKRGHQVDASTLHAEVCSVANQFCGSAAGFDICEDGISEPLLGKCVDEEHGGTQTLQTEARARQKQCTLLL